MFNNMVKKLGKENVKRIESFNNDAALQLEAKRFNADVILSIRGAHDEGGVWIDPQPSLIGKGGAEFKDNIINSKPSDNPVFWDIDLPDEVK